ncbi:MAG TPA: hypothetical protein QF764_12020 [Planctomycetota bacterium]|nr:hypothetical protein [Planctomycetota bacterium]
MNCPGDVLRRARATATTSALALLACGLVYGAGGQQGGDAGESPVTQDAPQVDDGELRPGVLPSDATPEARAAWAVLCEATLAPEPISAFDVSFHLRSRGDEPHDVDTRIRFLSPSYLRSEVRETGRGHLRGDRGDWLLDGDSELRLLGRGGAEDIRQIEETVAVARNFIALTDPRSVRIAGLSLLDGPPAELPDGFAGRGADLSWLALRSPDLRLTLDRAPTSAANRAPLYRALIGSDPLTGRIEFAIVQRDDGPRHIERTTLLLQLRGHFERDGFQVPREILIFGADPAARPRRFQSVPRLQLWVDDEGLDLRAPLTPADFRPASTAPTPAADGG